MAVSVFDCCKKSSIFRLGPVRGAAFRPQLKPPNLGGSREALPGVGGNSAVSISFVPAAAVDGQWQEWSSWSQCSVTCSNGTQQRSRQCTAAAHGGSECRGPWAESRECYNPECTGEYRLAPGAAALPLLLRGGSRAGLASSSEPGTGGTLADPRAATGLSGLQRGRAAASRERPGASLFFIS